MADEIIIILFSTVVSLGLGILLGHSVVYVFNKIPGKWLCDYGEKPSEELEHPTRQRIRSLPFKWIFTAGFTCLGMIYFLNEPIIALPSLLATWVLVEIAISDIKYMIIPDQFLIFLAITGVGFIPYYIYNEESILFQLFGGLVGFCIMFVFGLLAKLIFRQEGLGFGDIKLCCIVGIITGATGIIFIIALGFIMSFVGNLINLLKKKISIKDKVPVGQYFCFLTIIYMMFFMALGFYEKIPNLLEL